MSIAVLTPSRGRPDRFVEMVEETLSTADTPVWIYLATDDDDVGYPVPLGVKSYRGPRKRLAQWTNFLASRALEDGHDILAFFGDDHRPRTQGWDTAVETAMLEQGSGLVYCADGLQNAALPTAPFWSADVIKALGFYYPPVLMHLYADNYWLRLAHDLGKCRYLPDVLIEHMHPSNGKSEYDETYRENDTWYKHDREAFDRFVLDEHLGCLERVREALCASS